MTISADDEWNIICGPSCGRRTITFSFWVAGADLLDVDGVTPFNGWDLNTDDRFDFTTDFDFRFSLPAAFPFKVELLRTYVTPWLTKCRHWRCHVHLQPACG